MWILMAHTLGISVFQHSTEINRKWVGLKIKNMLTLKKILNYMSVDLKQINNISQNKDQKDPSQSRCCLYYTALYQNRKKKKYQLSYCCWSYSWASFMTEKFLRKQQMFLVEYYRNNICDCPGKDFWFFFPEYHQKLRIYQQNFCTEMTPYILSFPYFRWVSTGNANSSAW